MTTIVNKATRVSHFQLRTVTCVGFYSKTNFYTRSSPSKNLRLCNICEGTGHFDWSSGSSVNYRLNRDRHAGKTSFPGHKEPEVRDYRRHATILNEPVTSFTVQPNTRTTVLGIVDYRSRGIAELHAFTATVSTILRRRTFSCNEIFVRATTRNATPTFRDENAESDKNIDDCVDWLISELFLEPITSLERSQSRLLVVSEK